MNLADLPEATLEKIKSVHWDSILEKHEGPGTWESVLQYSHPEFLLVGEHHVLLPIDVEHHSNITILRDILSIDRSSLTLFLQDTTYSQNWYDSGFLAVCDRLENFFIAIVYHEWFVIERPSFFEAFKSNV
uniref:Uncharacterized protein n=1 Tax=Oscillatoriales cyanobacterium SpSt-418 TaxID=2282169 RepID=A0A7C3PRZ7_9CYAN